jgi:hypothetical protein
VGLCGSWNKRYVYLWVCLVLRTNVVCFCGIVCFLEQALHVFVDCLVLRTNIVCVCGFDWFLEQTLCVFVGLFGT